MSMTTSVVSAAILEGNLIIGLSDGSIINCGYVQGPPGLKGDPGPMGAVGNDGKDGNTILTSAGTPRNDSGVDGDYCIDNINWRIYGPKSGGVWGKGKSMLPDPENLIANGRGMSGSGGSIGGEGGGDGGGGIGGPVWTNMVRATGTGRLGTRGSGDKKDVYYPGSPNGLIDPAGPLSNQANINGWIVEALEELEEVIPINKVDTLPDEGQYEGDMVLHEGALWVWSGGVWIEIGGAVDTNDFATKVYANKVAAQFSNVAATQADWLNQTYSAGTWILQTGGAPNPELQRYILTDESFADTSELGNARYVSVHAYGGGDFIHYQYEKPGDTLQIYGNPLSGDEIGSFGIYEIEEITEHNFPDNPEDDGADLNTAFTTYTVKPLAFYGVVEADEICQIKTMPPVEAGGASVHVGTEAPDSYKEGDLWFNTTDTELTLYVYDGSVWVPAAPPVSLDGIDSRVSYLEPLVESQQQAVGQLRGVTVEQQKKLSKLETGLDNKLDKSGGKMTGKLICDRIGQNEEGFVIKGLKATLEQGNLLQTYHNGGDTPDAVNYYGRIDSPSNIVNKAYVDEKTKAPTEKYDGEFTFVAEAPTTKLEPGQVIFTNEDGAPSENPEKVANIHLSLDEFDWDECTESGSVKVTNHAGVLSGYFLVLDKEELEGRNMKLLVMFIQRTGSGGSIGITMDCTMNFRNVFLA